ncbi:Conserved hypothetical protein [Prochlorococcus marinus str. MIT 9303]|uniref:Uncharacterized protein n=1 Tax=Prochlorococcus marinus (strain MIT 9303) TaxID=59922 RepID=A2CBT4_PROM3|nr:Conserved hypothetical protein [Prochlorococcus marinus str. MIT 9303]
MVFTSRPTATKADQLLAGLKAIRLPVSTAFLALVNQD